MAKVAWITRLSRGNGTLASAPLLALPGQLLDVRLNYAVWTQTARTVTLSAEWTDASQTQWRFICSTKRTGGDPEGRSPSTGGCGFRVRLPQNGLLAFVRVTMVQVGTITCGVDGEIL